jgi:hypothetical protein
MVERAQRIRRFVATLLIAIGALVAISASSEMWQPVADTPAPVAETEAKGSAVELLKTLAVKGRAAKTGYERTRFGNGWAMVDGCDTRNIILNRDLTNVAIGDGCKVQSGTLNDPYTGKKIEFKRGADTSDDVQIDHVVALSDAWQKGAQQLTPEQREALANDPLELLAVDGSANQQKGDGDSATWLPPNKSFRCQYVARQIAVKAKYMLWVTQAEYDAMMRVLLTCPGQVLPDK